MKIAVNAIEAENLATGERIPIPVIGGGGGSSIDDDNISKTITYSSDKIESEIGTVKESLNELKPLEDNATFTVGANGDYETLTSAIADLSKKHNDNVHKATLRILSGTIIAEQIVIENYDAGWIDIVSEDAKVVCDANTVTRSYIQIPQYEEYSSLNISAFFSALNNAVLPNIKCMFTTINTRDGVVGIAVYNNSQAFISKDCGFEKAYTNLYGICNARISAFGAIFDDSTGNNVNIFRSSDLAIGGGKVRNANGYGIYVDSNSTAEVSNVIVSGCAQGLRVETNCNVAGTNTNLSNNVIGLAVANGGTFGGRDVKMDSCSNIGLNVQSSGVANCVGSSSAKNCSNYGVRVDSGRVNICNIVATGCGTGLYIENSADVLASNADFRKNITSESPNDVICYNASKLTANGLLGGIFGLPLGTITNNGLVLGKNSAWELIETINVSSDLTTLSKTKEPNGNDYHFYAMKVIVESAQGSTSESCEWNAKRQGNTLAGVNFDGAVNTGKRFYYATFTQEFGWWKCEGAKPANTLYLAHDMIRNSNYLEGMNTVAVHGFIAELSAKGKITSGSVIKIYAIRA